MKFIPAEILAILRTEPSSRRNVGLLLRFILLLVALIVAFSALFLFFMHLEGQEHSFISAIYWTMVTMSTLGFGDITFQSDMGRLFSIIVVLTGMIFLLMLLPFTFIEFFYSPWVKAQENARAPRKVQDSLTNHVIITRLEPVSEALIRKLNKYGFPYVVAVRDVAEALVLHDRNVPVVVADLNFPASFPNVGFERAAMVACTGNDFENTSVAFTAREYSRRATIAATANSPDSVDVLELAGCNHVMQLGSLLGASLARRVLAGDAQAHIIGEFDNLKIAEATTSGTPLAGKTLAESHLRELAGVTVVGLWERGRFITPTPDTRISENSVLVLAGTSEQMEAYNALFCIYHRSHTPVIVVGAGRVGRATGKMLAQLEIEHVIIESNSQRILDGHTMIHGSAAEYATLKRAGIQDAPAIILTAREDDVNIYLTIYCRKLRPDIQIISRATLESNVSRLHQAGADFVMSYASMGSSILFNLLRRGNILMVAEGLNVFRLKTPRPLIGKSIRGSKIREETACSIIAVQANGATDANPDPDLELQKNMELVLIGSVEAEDAFLRRYPVITSEKARLR